MSDEQQSSEHTRDLGAGHVDGELKDLAISLASSKEAMGVLGSALADHVVGALQAQGLMQGKSLTEAVSPPHSALMCLIK